MEASIKKTNDKLDDKLEVISDEMKAMNVKIDRNEDKSESVRRRMEDRLKRLKEQMRKSTELKEKREEIKRKEIEGKDLDRMEGLDKERQKSGSGNYNRRVIRKEDLVNDNVEMQPIYRSQWANEMEAELARVAGRMEKRVEPAGGLAGQDTSAQDSWVDQVEKEIGEIGSEERMDKQTDNANRLDRQRKVPNSWERLLKGEEKKKKPKVRKPIAVKDWFAEENSDESDNSSSESSGTGNEEWKNVEQKKKQLRKKKDRKIRMKEKMEEIASRMMHMVGVGPIVKQTVQHFEQMAGNPESARKMAIEEFLSFHLDFDQEELAKMNIVDTKPSAKEDIIYFTIEDKEQVREIYYRKALSENDDLIVREYIPPQFYDRWMAISRKATQVRANDKQIKTQMRWGMKDIEMFMKTKGSQEPFKKTYLKSFMEDEKLPDFNMEVQWKTRREGKPRRQLNLACKRTVLPSLVNQPALGEKQGLIRQLSTTSNASRGESAKKTKVDASSSEEQQIEMDDYESTISDEL